MDERNRERRERHDERRACVAPDGSRSDVFLRDGPGACVRCARDDRRIDGVAVRLDQHDLLFVEAERSHAHELELLLNENPLLEVTFTTAPMAQDYAVNGPIQADIWIATTMLDASLLVRVTDVAPDGSSRELTNGILTASLRQVDPARSRFLDGQMIQPWHPFTEASREDVGMNTPVLLPIEVFPSSFVIKQGHSLRVSVGASDFPHGLPPLVDLVDQAVGALTVYSDAGHASSIVVPAVPLAAIAATD